MGNCLKLFKEHSGPKTQKASSRFRCWQTWQEKLKVECQVLDWASISFTCWVFCDFFFARFWPLNSWILPYNYTITKKNTAMHHILGLCDMLHLFWQWWTIIFEEEMWSEQRTAALFSPLTEMLFFSSCLFKAPPPNTQSALIGQITPTWDSIASSGMSRAAMLNQFLHAKQMCDMATSGAGFSAGKRSIYWFQDRSHAQENI